MQTAKFVQKMCNSVGIPKLESAHALVNQWPAAPFAGVKCDQGLLVQSPWNAVQNMP